MKAGVAARQTSLLKRGGSGGSEEVTLLDLRDVLNSLVKEPVLREGRWDKVMRQSRGELHGGLHGGFADDDSLAFLLNAQQRSQAFFVL